MNSFVRKKSRETVRVRDLSSTGLLFKCLLTARLGQEPRTPLGSLMCVAGIQVLSCHLLPSGMCVSRKLELEAKLGRKPRYHDMDMTNGLLTALPSVPFNPHRELLTHSAGTSLLHRKCSINVRLLKVTSDIVKNNNTKTKTQTKTIKKQKTSAVLPSEL